MGCGYMFDYGMKTNMPRNMYDLSKTNLSYSVVATNLDNMVPKSMIGSTKGFADMLQLTHLKIQQAIAKAKPDGLIIDIEGLENVQLGKGGELQPLELHGYLQHWCYQQDLPEDVQLTLLPAVGELAAVALDAEALAEVLAQLLDNSLRYSEAPAQIQLQVQSTAVGVELRWQDQGLGIAAEPRDQVFQRFVRLEEHRHRSQADGAGLGLALCVALMQSMGGSIALEPVAKPSASVSFLLRWPQT